MIVIIDAYNLLHTCFESTHEQQKNAFIKKLSSYAKTTKRECIAVFDGGGSAFPSSNQQHDYLIIVHSGYLRSADHYIITFLEEKKGKKCIVVSYDREIKEAAQKSGHTSLEPSDFLSIVREILEPPSFCKSIPPSKKSSCKKYIYHKEREEDEENDEIDMFMQKYTRTLPFKEDVNEEAHTNCPRTFSKKERILHKTFLALRKKK